MMRLLHFIFIILHFAVSFEYAPLITFHFKRTFLLRGGAGYPLFPAPTFGGTAAIPHTGDVLQYCEN